MKKKVSPWKLLYQISLLVERNTWNTYKSLLISAKCGSGISYGKQWVGFKVGACEQVDQGTQISVKTYRSCLQVPIFLMFTS